MKNSACALAQSLDWDAARAHLHRAAREMEAAFRPPPERAEAIFKQRSEALARPVADGHPPEALLEILTFTLGAESYAIDVRYVREVVRRIAVTPLPGSDPVISGVVNLRGEILPLMDLRPLLDLPPSPSVQGLPIIVLGAERPECGISIDDLGDLASVEEADVLRPPPTAKRRDELLLGVSNSAVGVLDGQALLSGEQLCIGH